MLCHPEPGSAVSYALQNAKSPQTRGLHLGISTDPDLLIPR